VRAPTSWALHIAILVPDGVGQEMDGPGKSGDTPGAAREHVSHVLDVHSTHYEAFLADPKVVDEQLLACRCYRCSAPGPRLTGSRVSRKLHALPAFKVCSIALAVCLRCNSRERVLPCDALPGKVTGAEIVLDAVSRLRQGENLTAVAKACGVCRLSVQHWLAGLGARCLDLFGLLRHRAIVTSTASTGTLVRFAAFEAEAHRHRPALSLRSVWVVGSRPSERTELVAAVWLLVDLVHALGGTLATTQLGAALFRQAVLLFRSTPLDTSNFDASSSESPDTGAGQIGVAAPDDSPPSQSQGNRPVALRPGRGGACHSDLRRSGPGGACSGPPPGRVAQRADEGHLARDALPVDGAVQDRRARSPASRSPPGCRQAQGEAARGRPAQGLLAARRPTVPATVTHTVGSHM
jgi:hypothetical protein